MVKKNWVETVLLGIIALNIFVLSYVFLIPRAKFIIHNRGLNSETLMEMQGAMDTPNQYSKTYKVANQIRKVTKEDSIILD